MNWYDTLVLQSFPVGSVFRYTFNWQPKPITAEGSHWSIKGDISLAYYLGRFTPTPSANWRPKPPFVGFIYTEPKKNSLHFGHVSGSVITGSLITLFITGIFAHRDVGLGIYKSWSSVWDSKKWKSLRKLRWLSRWIFSTICFEEVKSPYLKDGVFSSGRHVAVFENPLSAQALLRWKWPLLFWTPALGRVGAA